MRKPWGPLTIAIVVLLTSRAYAKPLKMNFCGIDTRTKLQRMFAHGNDKQPWREYVHQSDTPTLELGEGQFATVWKVPTGGLAVLVEEPGEDFTSFTNYCFDNANKLIALQFELRTAWGWAYEEHSQIADAKRRVIESGFYSTRTDRRLQKRPHLADGIPDALVPKIVTSLSDFPFYNLLTQKQPKP